MRIYYNEIAWFGDIGCCLNQKGGNCFMFIIKRKVIAVVWDEILFFFKIYTNCYVRGLFSSFFLLLGVIKESVNIRSLGR